MIPVLGVTLTNIITNPHLYNASSQPGQWTVWINGSVVYGPQARTVAFYNDGNPLLGAGLNNFDGEIVEFLLYNQALSGSQRSTATNYLARKYNLW